MAPAFNMEVVYPGLFHTCLSLVQCFNNDFLSLNHSGSCTNKPQLEKQQLKASVITLIPFSDVWLSIELDCWHAMNTTRSNIDFQFNEYEIQNYMSVHIAEESKANHINFPFHHDWRSHFNQFKWQTRYVPTSHTFNLSFKHKPQINENWSKPRRLFKTNINRLHTVCMQLFRCNTAKRNTIMWNIIELLLQPTHKAGLVETKTKGNENTPKILLSWHCNQFTWLE